MEITFYGVRSSWPQRGHKSRIGCHTVCTKVDLGGRPFLLDAGTGLSLFSKEIQDKSLKQATLFLSHYHIDHILGIVALSQLFGGDFLLTIYAPNLYAFQPEFIFERFIQPPLYPFTFSFLKKNIRFKIFNPGDTLKDEGITVHTIKLHHPGSSCGYKLIHEKKSLCYITDVGPLHKESPYPRALHQFIKDTNLLIHDTSFTGEDFEHYHDHGHYAFEHVCLAAKVSHVKKLALFHHNPRYDDQKLFMMEKTAKTIFPKSFLAKEGKTIRI